MYDFIIIESHFWVPDHAIRPETRNICSKELVAMIYRIAEILYPNEKIEVLFLPPDIGCYKDTVKIIWTLWTIVTIIWGVYTHLSYIDSHANSQLDATQKCIEILKQFESLSWENIILKEEKLSMLCEDHSLIKMKNNRYKTLEKDETIAYEETVIKNPDNQILLQKTIERSEFKNMIITLPEDDDFEQDNIEWIIELISLVVKQKKEWKWIPRRGTYYGEDIIHNWIKVLGHWEEISFFMQDQEFKKQIQNQEISFASGDNIIAIFKLKTEIRSGLIANTHIHVKEVKKFNAVEIGHTIKPKKNKEQAMQMQSLFEESFIS